MDQKRWQIWVDTGGTFTDCIALDPDGNFNKIKVLSNSALRGTVQKQIDKKTLRISQSWSAPEDFIRNFRFTLLDIDHPDLTVSSFDPESSEIILDQPLPETDLRGNPFEVTSSEEAPVLAARLVTKTAFESSLPPVRMRLATTRGTNALLERKGAPTLLFITEGFGDLLRIGDQTRPDLFALDVQKPAPLHHRVVEISERMDADGNAIKNPDLEMLQDRLSEIDDIEKYTAAVCLMHSYKNSAHEEQVAEKVKELGIKHISVSSKLNPFIKVLPRTQTTVVDAYLSPVLDDYLDSVKRSMGDGDLRIMTSAGGLAGQDYFNPKDSLLSGPAGGVVGASAAGKEAGYDHIISFDMGGTSTDVARYDEAFDYVFEHQVGDARLAAPALAIETVAAGGGSICSFDGFKLTVGPESAGADPGPACYGADGPFTLTDVNLLLGKLEPDNFGIPVSPEAAKKKFDTILELIQNSSDNSIDETDILEGFLDIANERMADAIRKISLRKGYDPANYALVAFGGAGAQHSCAIAGQLGITDIVVPANAGLLSAYGIGNAAVERFAEEQVLELLDDAGSELPKKFERLEKEASAKLKQEGVAASEITIRRRLLFMRLKGQESTLEISFESGNDIKANFKEAYRDRYGHWITNREIEIESLRVVASSQTEIPEQVQYDAESPPGKPVRIKKTVFSGRKRETPVFHRNALTAGQQVSGPALILDPYSTIVLEPGWSGEVLKNGSLKLSSKNQTASNVEGRSEAVSLELFTNRLTSIADEMGEMLRRTALSVNVKERRDFSCALLNAEGELIVNAPHIPVHLGALGICIRRLKESVEMQPGDVVVTNHPAFGGSHLPDVTVATPVFKDQKKLIGFAASRAHHAEIGGIRPGSMPPEATTLAEEGVVIPPFHLIKQGEERWGAMRSLLIDATFPTRSIEENIADLQAAVAANHRGVDSLLKLVDRYGEDKVLHYMEALKQYAAQKMRTTLKKIKNGVYESTEYLDDGTPLHVSISIENERISFDFEGTGNVHPGNLNATPAIVNSVIIYILRLLVEESLPLNEGLLEPVKIHLPRCLLNPKFENAPEKCPAVVGGNVETSQRLVDLLLKPFERAACSQGTMNNILFGDESFGYYETVGGGTGAGPGFDGSDAVHHHMTNTAGTDPEILEQRYPVRLERYAIRKNSGGMGKRSGGNGIVRVFTFLSPVNLSILTQHRNYAPYGLNGGEPGATGEQWIIRENGEKERLDSIDGRELEPGEQFILYTPGGGGYGVSE